MGKEGQDPGFILLTATSQLVSIVQYNAIKVPSRSLAAFFRKNRDLMDSVFVRTQSGKPKPAALCHRGDKNLKPFWLWRLEEDLGCQ